MTRREYINAYHSVSESITAEELFKSPVAVLVGYYLIEYIHNPLGQLLLDVEQGRLSYEKSLLIEMDLYEITTTEE